MAFFLPRGSDGCNHCSISCSTIVALKKTSCSFQNRSEIAYAMRAVSVYFLMQIKAFVNRTVWHIIYFKVNSNCGETGYIVGLCSVSAGENGNTLQSQLGLLLCLFPMSHIVGSSLSLIVVVRSFWPPAICSND